VFSPYLALIKFPNFSSGALLLKEIRLNSVALVSERTIPTERTPLVVEDSANFCGKSVLRGQRNGSLWPYSRFSRPEQLRFSSKVLFDCIHEAEWTPLGKNCFSEKLAVPRKEHGIFGYVARDSGR
jgi:hypothetical protein